VIPRRELKSGSCRPEPFQDPGESTAHGVSIEISMEMVVKDDGGDDDDEMRFYLTGSTNKRR
jgi:hypothetical protein